MEHKYIEHKNCDTPYCNICEGGLSICSVCGLAEGCLTTECPGVQSYGEYGDLVYKGKKDFVNGKWVDCVYHHSPEYYK